jgi:hypothetical protein
VRDLIVGGIAGALVMIALATPAVMLIIRRRVAIELEPTGATDDWSPSGEYECMGPRHRRDPRVEPADAFDEYEPAHLYRDTARQLRVLPEGAGEDTRRIVAEHYRSARGARDEQG